MIDRAFELILKLAGVEDAIAQSELVIQLQQKLKLDPDHPPDNFDGVYVCTLVKYIHDEVGNRRPTALLKFFRHQKIRQFIRQTYDGESVTSHLHNEIAELLIGPLGQELTAQGIDLAAEMQCFEALFTEVVKRTRKPKEVLQERELSQRFDQLEQQIQQQNLALQAAINQKLAQLPGGHSAALPAAEIAVEFPLVRQVKAWFKALDYGEDNYSQATEDYCEWITTIPARRGFDRILVRCVKGEASPTDVEELFTAVEAQETDEGWLVYNRRISKTARTLLEDRQYRRVLFSYTLDELIDQAADFSNYIDWLEKEVKARGIDTDYVQLACRKDDIDLTTQRKIGTSRYSDTEGGIEGYIDGWLEDDAKEHLSVLGEFGTGKTWFSFHYAWLVLQKYQQSKEKGGKRSRLPLVIPLRDYAKALDVENVIANFFFNKHDIRITSKMFTQLNRMGKLLLVFDGFDEMAARVDKQAMINNFWELARVVGPGAKAILTCRTEHFPDAKQGRELLSAELMASTKNLTGEPPEFEVLELEKFNENQIRDMLANRTDETMVEKVMGNAKLMELAERPVMVDLILDALPKIESLAQVDELNMSRVYLYAVTQRLEKDKRDQRTFTSLADKLYFLCEVSWEMLQTDQMSLHFTAFPERLQRLFGDKVREQRDLDHWHYDMMGQTMLVRDDEGNYRPAHRSLLEFFAAYKIVASLGIMEEDFLEIARTQSHTNKRTKPKRYTWEEYFRRQCNEQHELISIAPLQQFDASAFKLLVNLIGSNKLAKTVLDLSSSMVSRKSIREKLLPLIQQTKGYTLHDIGFIGSNITQLMLEKDNQALEQVDLSETLLSEVNFANASLRYASLRQSNLTTSVFTKALGSVLSVAFSPDGTLIALGDSNGTVQLWDTKNYQVIMIQKAHENEVRSVAFSPDGYILATGSYDNTVKLWSVSQKNELLCFSGHTSGVSAVAFSPDSQILATGSCDNIVKLWSVAEKKELASLVGHEDELRAVTFSPDGQILATGSHDTTVRLWSVKKKKELACLSGHQNWVRSIAFSPSGHILATGSYDNIVKLWSTSESIELASLKGHTNGVRSVAFSPDGEVLATGSADNTVKLWSVNEKQELGSLISHTYWVNSLAFSPNGKTLATGSYDNTVKFWSVNERQEIASFAGHTHGIRSIAFSPDGETLATDTINNTIKLWSVSKKRELTSLSGHKYWVMSVAFSPDGEIIATGSADKTVKLWSVREKRELVSLTGHKYWVMSVAFSPDGEIIATGSADKTVKLWSVREKRELVSLTGHRAGTISVAFSPDGQTLATSSHDETVKLWSVSEMQETVSLTGHKDGVTSIVFSPDGDTLATSSYDSTIKLWSISKKQELVTLIGHKYAVTSAAFSPDGCLLATSGYDNTVKLWSVNEKQELKSMTGHKNPVLSVAFSPNGRILATGSADQSIRLWDVSTGICTVVLDERPYLNLDITGAFGLTDAQRTSLKILGAVDYTQISA